MPHKPLNLEALAFLEDDEYDDPRGRQTMLLFGKKYSEALIVRRECAVQAPTKQALDYHGIRVDDVLCGGHIRVYLCGTTTSRNKIFSGRARKYGISQPLHRTRRAI